MTTTVAETKIYFQTTRLDVDVVLTDRCTVTVQKLLRILKIATVKTGVKPQQPLNKLTYWLFLNIHYVDKSRT